MNQSTPLLYLLVGLPASGKSTEAKRMKEENPNLIVLSSDSLRGVIGEDENDQTKNKEVFQTLFYMTEYFLRQGSSVLIDAMNGNRKARRGFLDIAKKLGIETVALVILPDLAKCIEGNEERGKGGGRAVPNWVIERAFNMWEQPEDFCPKFPSDAFDLVKCIYSK